MFIGNYLHHRHEVHSQLLEWIGETAAFIEPADALLDRAASPTEPAVEAAASIIRALVRAPRNDHVDRVTMKPGANMRWP